jgi:single-strand DNA-binding protein
MYSLNKAQLIGNVTRDPEVKQIPSGQMVCTIGIATNRSWKDQSGQKQEQTEFHNVVCWGRLAEIAGQYLKKGTKVYFEGRIQTRNWENDQGVKQYRTEIVGENMIILTPKGGVSGEQDYSGGISRGQSPASQQNEDYAPMREEKISVDDLPF